MQSSSEVLGRLRLLQSHLCSYAQRSVPVVNLDLANFNDTLDDLHDYLLLCIQMALEEDDGQDHAVPEAAQCMVTTMNASVLSAANGAAP